jgi:hypothetical protein
MDIADKIRKIEALIAGAKDEESETVIAGEIPVLQDASIS